MRLTEPSVLSRVSTVSLTSRSGSCIIGLQDDPDAASNTNSDNMIGMNFFISIFVDVRTKVCKKLVFSEHYFDNRKKVSLFVDCL